MKKREKKIGIIDKIINPQLRKVRILSEIEKKEIYDNVVQKAKELVPDINEEEIYNRLNDSGNIVIGKENNKSISISSSRAYYIEASNLIFLYSKNSKRTIFHESMHKLQRKINKKLVSIKYPIGINEGAVEYTAERAYGDGTSRFLYVGNYDLRMNFSEDAIYEIEVAIISQINQILGNDRVIKSVLNGDISWTEEFKKEYGENNFYNVCKLVNKLHHKSMTQRDVKTIKQIQECQNILLKCYDEKFKYCITEQDYLNYLQDLQKFQTCQIGIEGDKSYEYYQKTMFEKIKEIFISKGYSINKLNNYIYKEPEYNPTMTVEKQVKGLEIDILGIARDCAVTDKIHELSEYTRKMDPNNLGYDIIQRDGKLISCRVWKEKSWQSCYNPIVIEDKTIKNKFNMEENQVLYKIDENIFIVGNADGDVKLYDINGSQTKKVEGFKQIDIGITPEFYRDKIEKYVKNEKKEIRLEKKNNKKMLKGKEKIAMLPEAHTEAQIDKIDEVKRFKESLHKENYSSQNQNYEKKSYYIQRSEKDKGKSINHQQILTEDETRQ